MTLGYTAVLLAVDPLQTAVAQDMATRYCPHSKAAFLTRLLVLFAIAIAAALSLFVAAYRNRQGPSGRALLYIVAGALLLFAIGAGGLVLYGLSGCSGAAAEGLNWDWP